MAIEKQRWRLERVASDQGVGWTYELRDGRRSQMVFKTSKDAARAAKRALNRLEPTHEP